MYESGSFSQWTLAFRKAEMTNITLNCLIIPSGQFNALSRDNLSLIITLPRNGAVNTLETSIQSELEPPYNNIPLDIRQVYYPGSVDERRMQTQALISAYFKGDPPANLFHVVASSIPPPSY
ncbi:hypothetical protein RclHR1_05900001 [Rhizophagus clarus]|uniref:Uncharacterized protein n=1 Tax=Rhizophagus clarus TaxID=94130 RepID=A0A2Z6RQD8_9GLOM|nr:hypothetical protein RclHR1_05900001 [Rhizophagus clarus]